MNPPQHSLRPEPLTELSFRDFGDVIEAGDARRHFTINDGHAERYHDLARIVALGEGARVVVSIFSARPRALPMAVELMERHTLGSQAFMPLDARPYLVIVARAGTAPAPRDLRCFHVRGGQGVNFAPGTWHHPLIALEAPSNFLVIDREAADGSTDCDVVTLSPAAVVG